MSTSAPALADRWPLPGASELRDRLLAAYAAPERRYHDLAHLREVLERLDELEAAGAVFDGDVVRLAAWFHDAVYDGRPEAEERSARWAEDALGQLLPHDRVSTVARLVRMTADHRPGVDDADGHALSDADLGILAATPTRYAAYVAAVREEYAALPDDLFRAGRLAVVRELSAKPTLFHTAAAIDLWETAARANLAGEIADLESVADTGDRGRHNDQRS